MSDVAGGIVAVLNDAAPDELHWTVVLDRVLRGGYVEPSPAAREQVLHALALVVKDGRAVKTSKGTYRAPG